MSANRVYLLALLLVAAQGLLAWHGPSHLGAADDHAGAPVLNISDCELCTFGQGLATAPAFPVAAPAPRGSTAVPAPISGPNPPAIPGAGARAPPLLS